MNDMKVQNDYFSDLITTHSWSAVKYDLYGFKFYTLHVLGQTWQIPRLIRPPKTQRLTDIVTRSTPDMLIAATAQEHLLVIATRNVRDFMGCGVQVVNPLEHGNCAHGGYINWQIRPVDRRAFSGKF